MCDRRFERCRDDYALAAVRLATAASVAGIGADVDDSDDAARARERIRAFARARLARPGPDGQQEADERNRLVTDRPHAETVGQ